VKETALFRDVNTTENIRVED